MRIKTAAKINLALDVTGKLPNGYHTIESVFQTVGLYDVIDIELCSSGISVSCDVPEMFRASDDIPCDERNIAYKAASRFFEKTAYNGGCSIHITKGIPSQAGMGGGSSDAAAVLFALNKLTNAPLSNSELAELGKTLGADVPFFFTGGTAYVSGIGDIISPLPSFAGRSLIIAKGNDGVSTAEAYAKIDALTAPQHPQVSELVKALKTAPDKAFSFFGNLFESALQLDDVRNISSIMLGNNAGNALMTGSGSAVFGIFSGGFSPALEKLRSSGFFAEHCLTVDSAFTVVD